MVVGGLITGLILSFRKVSEDVKKKVDDATAQLDELKGQAVAGVRMAADEDTAKAVEEKADQVKSTLGEISSLVGSLPEHLRFAGLSVLVGAVLMSVATVQFGGHSIF